MSWNLGNSTTWAIDPNSVNEIGCIHTAQGLEFDYAGVIIGNDLRYENDKVITDVKERARRRYKENLEKGTNMTYEEVLEKIKIRDHNDSNKEIGALKIAEDAIVIDTTYLTIEQVKEKVADIINKAKGGQQC